MNDFKSKLNQSLNSKLETVNSIDQKPPPILVPNLFSISSAKFNLKPTQFTKTSNQPISPPHSTFISSSSSSSSSTTISNLNQTSPCKDTIHSKLKTNPNQHSNLLDQSPIISEDQTIISLDSKNECKNNTIDQIGSSTSNPSAHHHHHHSIMSSNSSSSDLPQEEEQAEEVEEIEGEQDRVQAEEAEEAEVEQDRIQAQELEAAEEAQDRIQAKEADEAADEEQDRVQAQEAEEAEEAEDQVQDWQTQFHHNSTTSTSSDDQNPTSSTSENRTLLERANSAAARLDSLARLNGVKTPTSNEGHPDDQDSDDELPPFLRYLDEIQKKPSQVPSLNPLSLHQTLQSASAYPLLPPTGLGFAVGPNGRGVPRLSALQRKALEKMEKMEKKNGVDPHQTVIGRQSSLGGATLLSRSHTTTGTERTCRLDVSALQARNKGLQRSQTPNELPQNLSTTFPSASTEREQARSNLIRKLSSRSGAAPGRQTKSKVIPSELNNPLATPAIPMQDQEPSLLPYLNSRSRPRSVSINDLGILTDAEGTSSKESKDINLDLSIHLHTPQQITFEPDYAEPDSTAFVVSGHQPDSTPESQSAGSIGKVNEVDPNDEQVTVKRIETTNGLDHTCSLQPSARSSSIHTTTTNRASSSALSNFTLNSEFRSYRHSLERDRDSVLDRMGLIDNTLDNEINGHLVSDSAEPLPYEAIPELPSLSDSLSNDLITDNSQQIEGDTKTGNREEKRVITSLPPFNSMLNYDEDQLCSVSTPSTLCPPQKSSICMDHIITPTFERSPIHSSKPIPTSSTSNTTICPTRLIVHQTTTTTISGVVGDEDALSDSSPLHSIIDDIVSPTLDQELVTVKGSGSYFDDIIFSPAPDLPETIIKYDEDGLADYKFPTSRAIRRTSLKTLREDGEGGNRLNEDEKVKSVDEPTMMIEESSCSLSPVAITSSSPWRESDGYCPRSTHSPPNAPKPVSQTMADATYQDQVNRALEEMSRGSTASSLSNGLSNPERPSSHSPVMPIKRRLSPVQPLHPIERPRPRRPSNPPPIVQPHHTLCRSPPPPTPPVKPHMHSLGPSQFPPAPNMAKSHMPPASAHDLARYNDSKLAPFPALLSSSYVTSPPLAPSQITTSTNSTHNAGSVTSTPTLTSASSMSPGFSDSSLKSISPPSQPTKPSRSHGNSILSTATSFISSSLGHAHHGRASSSSSSISTSLIGQPVLIESSRTNFANCTQAGQAAHLMSPSLSQNGFNLDRFDEAEEHIEEIDPRASDTIDNRDSHSGPPYRQNSISAGIKRSSSKAASTSSPIPESSSAHPLLPQSSLMSRSSVSHSSQSSLRSSSSDHRQQILQKLGPFLNLSDFTKPNLSQRPSMLNQPPRKLRLHGPVLQVVNSTSVKDRYLFLFNDILVITKPIIEFEPNLSPEGERIPKLPITLNQSFLTKSVVELSKLECVRPRIDTKAINGNVEVKEATSLTNETKPPSSKSNVLLIQQFIGQFAIDPEQTISDAIQRGVIQEDSVSIAKVLFMTTELDKKQLGSYLSRTENVKVLKSFIDRFKFHHCRIDDALRVFMLSIRLPNDLQAVEVLLATFASQWSAVNQAIGISQSLALRLIKALFGLNDALHTSLHDSTKYVTNTFSLPHGAAHSPQHFIEFFKAENQMNQSYNSRRSIESSSEEFEPEKMISDEKLELLLNKVYVSVARDKIVQAKATDEETEPIIVTNSIAESDPEGGGAMNTFPNRLTYMIGSDQITFTIPEIDSHFGIKLFSTGLKFEPPFLTFSKSRSASFRIIGRSLGICHITFIKIGSKASKYVGLPYSKPILVERAFMKDTLQISFMNHLKTKRKYLFSFESLESRESFLEVVEYSQQQLKAQNEKLERKIGKKEDEVAELAALQVLRDTLIPNEDFMPLTVNPHTHTTISLKSSKPHSKLSNPNSQSSTNEDKSKGGLSTEEKKPSRIRSNSLSETYIHQTGSKEKDLQSIIVNKRMIAQQLHIKKKQQKLLQIHLRSNIEGGKLGLNPYSISLAKQSNGLHHHHHHQTNMGNGTGNLMEEKDEVEVFFEKFWMKGDEVIHQCQQNSLIPLVLRFISQGVIIEKK